MLHSLHFRKKRVNTVQSLKMSLDIMPPIVTYTLYAGFTETVKTRFEEAVKKVVELNPNLRGQMLRNAHGMQRNTI